MTPDQIRVRFAPSPTGTLHVGGARTALFNWLFARSQNGAFILRIEDTDQSRYDARAETSLLEDLRWMGLNWDEGEGRGGDYGPYRQSQRLELYRSHAHTLIDSGNAYYCFCTADRLDGIREKQRLEKQPQGYDRHCRDMAPGEVEKKLEEGLPYVVRLKVPLEGRTVFSDTLRGDIGYDNKELDDLILLKSDGYPSYHLANVVDDHAMRISHVLRGEEWIPSTPKHVLLYNSFGWRPPVFVHLPVILAEGGGKLSKRKGAVSVGEYKQLGYLPQTLTNFLALLGWNPGGDREILSTNDLRNTFSLDRITPKSCSFDTRKLEWMNGQYIMNTEPEALVPVVRDCVKQNLSGGKELDSDYLMRVILLMRERVKKIPEFWENGFYFFEDPEQYEEKAEKKHFGSEASGVLGSVKNSVSTVAPFAEGEIESAFRGLGESLQMGLGKLVHPTRLALCGISFGPGLFELMVALGRETVLRRLESAIGYLEVKNETKRKT